ncbi:MAG: tRNA (adenosine(37)-N6)-threonylcarbamoyltransferase complex dimerization subunit type 1 TsaB [Chloroflexi bacterium]|nr:tRNA (adenosine(37)-N6)-threonylcarbamoyltransferase complex dimerization subunit type 1 TsaB [Chloroflexota bacterium]MCL5076267.1 tRNA (adenosine(37)-N6)-threonylcarbamoyltransferase complex dimerization subunit type 1 TsaB [Chloroflexota bacterium]
MLLAIDTSTRLASIALYHDGVRAECTWWVDQSCTRRLLPQVQQMLTQDGSASLQLSGLAVAIGPGSFTGLRAGLSTAKGLAFALSIPIVGVSTLESTAYQYAQPGLLIRPLLEAGRGEVYTALYKAEGNDWKQVEKPELTILSTVYQRTQRPTLICGEISLQLIGEIKARLGTLAIIPRAAALLRRAGYLAELGWKRIQDNQIDDPATLEPLYLRQPAVTRPKGPVMDRDTVEKSRG